MNECYWVSPFSRLSAQRVICVDSGTLNSSKSSIFTRTVATSRVVSSQTWRGNVWRFITVSFRFLRYAPIRGWRRSIIIRIIVTWESFRFTFSLSGFFAFVHILNFILWAFVPWFRSYGAVSDLIPTLGFGYIQIFRRGLRGPFRVWQMVKWAVELVLVRIHPRHHLHFGLPHYPLVCHSPSLHLQFG